MSMQDPISDMFVRIKNAQAVEKNIVSMPSSKVKVAIAKLLKEEGFIIDYKINNYDDNKAILEIVLKYFQGKPVIAKLERVSKPSIRSYRGFDNLPKVMGGLGVCIVSTSKGIMSDRNAVNLKQGGEVIGIVA